MNGDMSEYLDSTSDFELLRLHSRLFAILQKILRNKLDMVAMKSRKENPRKRPRAPPNSLINESVGKTNTW